MTAHPPAAGPARPYYGWPMLACLSAAETLSWGVLYYSFAVFVRPIEQETGWSRAQVTGAFSAALLASGLAAVPVGRWLDAHGARGLMTAGAAAGALLLAALAGVSSLPALYAVWIGLGVVMAAVLYEPAFAVVATWFVRRRDRALTILTVSAGLASTLVVPLTTWLVAAYGWRRAALGLAALLACTTVPLHGLTLRRSPAAVGQHPDGDLVPPDTAPIAVRPAAASDPRLWAFTGALTLVSLVTVAATVHLVPYLVGEGSTPARAASTVGLIGVMQLPGRLAFGRARRAFAWPSLAAAVFLLQAAALAMLAGTTGDAPLAAFAVLFGVGNGMATLLRASTLAELAGPDRYGSTGGVVSLFTTLGRAAGPLLASLAYVASGSYRAVLAGMVALLVAAATLVLAAARPRGSAERDSSALAHGLGG
ncbi:MAG: MFS transporter [Vicinamibacteria bacterium]